jgi:ribosomal-protein-alanine N-acetyltransferase
MARGREIETTRLRLRPMRADDVDALLSIFAGPTVMASFGGVLFGRAEMQHWVQRNLEHQAQHGYGLFSVILKAKETLVGDCGLEHMTVGGAAEVELGYDFKGAFWNRGLATEAAAAVRDHAFGTLQLPRLISLIRPGNPASQRVAEKIGMRLTGTVLNHDQEYSLFSLSQRDLPHQPADEGS